MSKSVPTLLGIVIILLVVVLVVLVFNYKLTQQLGAGATVVGTQGGEMLTGAKAPKEEIGTSTVLGARQPQSEAVPSPAMKETPAERRGPKNPAAAEKRRPGGAAETGQGTK